LQVEISSSAAAAVAIKITKETRKCWKTHCCKFVTISVFT